MNGSVTSFHHAINSTDMAMISFCLPIKSSPDPFTSFNNSMTSFYGKKKCLSFGRKSPDGKKRCFFDKKNALDGKKK